MLLYVVGTVLSVSFAKLATTRYLPNGKRLSNGFLKLFELFSILPLALIAALRVNVGTDFAAYEAIYEQAVNLTNYGEGFQLFVNALRNVSVDSRLFFAVTATIICASFIHIAINESEDPAFAVLFFVISEDYFVSMNIIVQFLAIAFIWFSVRALRKKQWEKAIVLCLVAATFHRTALFFLVMIALHKCNLPIKKIIIATAVGVVVGFLCQKQLESLLIQYSGYGEYFSSKYATEQYPFALPMLLIYGCVFIATVVLTDMKSLNEKPECRLFMIAVLINMAVMALSYVLTGNTYRLTNYFNGVIGLYFPSVLKEMKTGKNQFILKTAVILLFTIWTTLLIIHSNQNVLPYHSIL